jgi:acyl carrier protein
MAVPDGQLEGIKAAIRGYVAQNILFSRNGYAYPDDASFLNEGIISSMNILELVMFAEEHFGVSVDDQDLVPDNFDSVTCMAAYIERKTQP